MMNLIFLILLIFSMRHSDELLSLIKAEKSFSAMSSAKGIRTAFLTYFDDEAIVFAPKPVKGKERYRNSDTIPGHLHWEPQFADISSSGNLGYTTGPWKLDNNSKISFGHFVSIWEKKQDRWQVIMDTGINYDEPFPQIKEVNSSSGTTGHFILMEPGQKEIAELDTIINTTEDYKNYLSEDIIFLSPGKHPSIGLNPVMNYINDHIIPFSVEQQFQKISSANDLAYSYGYLKYKNNSPDCYLRIWKRSAEGNWKLVLELAKPAE